MRRGICARLEKVYLIESNLSFYKGASVSLTNDRESIFSDRISDVPRSFIREILKVAIDPSIISFAGGLPNRELFPVEEIKRAAMKVLEADGKNALQYSNSEGFIELREYISDRYRRKQGIEIPVENILITNGSQQGLDLLSKVILNEHDCVVVEEPGYLGALQTFAVYRSKLVPVPVTESGMDVDSLKHAIRQNSVKLIYTVPNFQNPSGITYSQVNREKIAKLVKGTNILLVQDDPYGELRYEGKDKESFKALIPENTVLLGSFSKTVSPGIRIGWIVLPSFLVEKMVIAKQASDLHTSNFSQRILHRYLTDNDLDKHVSKIRDVYDRQRIAMLESIERHFPGGVKTTRPEGGMFLWVTLPNQTPAMGLFHEAIKKKVAFVPGDPFYVNKKDVNTLRLNFSCVGEQTIETGIRRLGEVINERAGV